MRWEHIDAYQAKTAKVKELAMNKAGALVKICAKRTTLAIRMRCLMIKEEPHAKWTQIAAERADVPWACARD